MTDPTPQPDTDDAQPADQSRTESGLEEADRRSDAEREAADESEVDAETETATDEFRSTDVWRYLVWGALGVCSLLALFAVVQFYGSVTDAIDLWVEPRYRPLIHAAFNLVVLLGSLIGASLLVREVS